MKEQEELRTKSVNVNGMLMAVSVYLTKKVVSHKNNKKLSLESGWHNLEVKCEGGCPPADSGGYYMCIGGNCVYFPNP